MSGPVLVDLDTLERAVLDAQYHEFPSVRRAEIDRIFRETRAARAAAPPVEPGPYPLPPHDGDDPAENFRDREAGLREAADWFLRSAEGRCSNPRCPSEHEGSADDCFDYHAERLRAALASDKPGLDVERLRQAVTNVDKAYPGHGWIEDVAAEYARLNGGSDEPNQWG